MIYGRWPRCKSRPQPSGGKHGDSGVRASEEGTAYRTGRYEPAAAATLCGRRVPADVLGADGAWLDQPLTVRDPRVDADELGHDDDRGTGRHAWSGRLECAGKDCPVVGAAARLVAVGGDDRRDHLGSGGSGRSARAGDVLSVGGVAEPHGARLRRGARLPRLCAAYRAAGAVLLHAARRGRGYGRRRSRHGWAERCNHRSCRRRRAARQLHGAPRIRRRTRLAAGAGRRSRRALPAAAARRQRGRAVSLGGAARRRWSRPQRDLPQPRCFPTALSRADFG